ncbi:MAG: TolC family protein [Desulfobacterales bacterium]
MIRLYSPLLALVLLGNPLGLAAEKPDSNPGALPEQRFAQGVTAADLIRYAYDHNPSLTVAREAWAARVETYRIVTGYPDPELMISYFPDPIETRLGPQDWNASLAFKIPFPGKLSQAGEVAAAEAHIAQLELDQAVRDMIVEIRQSAAELHYIKQARRVAQANLELVAHLRKVAEMAHADARANLVDVVKAQSQVGQLRYDLLLLDELAMTEITRLNGLLNRPPEAPLVLVTETFDPAPAVDISQIYQWAETHQQEIQIRGAQIAKAEAGIGLARKENGPDFKVGLFYAGIGDPDGGTPPPDAGKDALGVQLGVSIPLWVNKNKGRLNRARALKRQAQAAKTQRITQTRTEIRALYFRLQNALRLMALYRDELLPQAAHSMELAETWFRQGESTFSDFVEAQAVWYNFQLSLARARADYQKYLAGLERWVGRSLTPEEAS